MSDALVRNDLNGELIRTNPLAVLRPELLNEPAISRIRSELRAGNVCIIRGAFQDAFAEAVFDCLDRVPRWEPNGRVHPFSGFRSLSLPDQTLVRDELLPARNWFADRSVRAFFSELTGADCGGEMIFNATHYGPGDYVLPHNDVGGSRSVTFVWSLSKDWEAKWGGHFFWCDPPASVSPTFNMLILFRVSPRSYHFVTPVSAQAKAKRLSLSGWWTSTEALGENPPPPAAWYRGPLDEVAPSTFVIRVDGSSE